MNLKTVDIAIRKIRVRTHDDRSFQAALVGAEMKPLVSPEGPKLTPEELAESEAITAAAVKRMGEAIANSK